MEELYHRLMKDLSSIGLNESFTLKLKPYSKTFYGRYDPNKNTITLYVYEDEGCSKLFPYKELLLTLIHEAVHCIQWHDESFVRVKGIMHDAEFYRIYNKYKVRAEALLYFKEVTTSAKKEAFNPKTVAVSV